MVAPRSSLLGAGPLASSRQSLERSFFSDFDVPSFAVCMREFCTSRDLARLGNMAQITDVQRPECVDLTSASQRTLLCPRSPKHKGHKSKNRKTLQLS